MHMNSFVVGILLTAALAFYWHRTTMKDMLKAYSELRCMWLHSEFGADVRQTEGTYFLAWREGGKKVIMFFDNEDHARKSAVLYELPVNSPRKWEYLQNPWYGNWTAKSIWDEQS